ncbi:peptide deformylase [bacterium]|nr:peptide deformylase [bacterium]
MKKSMVYYPATVLRQQCLPLKELDEETISLVEEMKQIMDSKNGLGLAAPQVGVSKRLFIAIDPDNPVNGPIALINPEFDYQSEETEESEEGCLCFPGLYLDLKRPKFVRVKAQKLVDGKLVPLELEGKGLFARILCHEIDHLNGVLIIDHISTTRREMIKGKLKEISENYGNKE